MNGVLRLPVPLAVAGLALVVCGVRGAHAPAAEAATTPLPYVPPAIVAATTPHAPVHVIPDGRSASAHTAAHAAKTSPNRRPHHATADATAPEGAGAATHATKPAPAPSASASTPAVDAGVSGPTQWSALNAAIARIPTYRSGASRWTVSSKYDFWGTADWYHDVLYVDPSVPVDKLYDVAVHEWSHELSVLDYGGDVMAATRAMNANFGGTGLTGAERAADCMAILQGATWTHYTTCTNSAWRAAAALLVAGHTL